MKGREKLKRAIKISLSFVLMTTAAFCVLRRLPECFDSQNPAALAAAAFTLTDGSYRLEAPTTAPPEKSDGEKPSGSKSAVIAQAVTSAEKKPKDKTGYYDTNADHSGEKRYSVNEVSIGHTGEKVGSGYIRNRTGLEFDFGAALLKPLAFSVEKNSSSPQVLVYHTHTGESYLDESVDYYYQSYYSHTQNSGYNVTSVGEVLTERLNSLGINTLHDTTVHDSTYNGSYDRSALTVQSDMEEYRDIKVVLDLHRDALGSDDYKTKTVFEYDGKKGAQIMILSGCDFYGERGFDCWRDNLSFALKLEDRAEELYPGMTRDVSFDFFAYNEYICPGSLLIEIGTDANSIEEAEYTAELLSKVLFEVLTE